MSEVPHPFVQESMELFKSMNAADKQKVYFIHFNHTNSLLKTNSDAAKEVRQKGFNIATEGMILNME
jgi:pyrroloquinoline quinone biosynthesis protein B